MIWRSASRAYERLSADYNRLVDEHNANDAEWSARYDRLLTLYHELRVGGANAPQPQPPTTLPRKERDDVMDAIDLQAGTDPTLKRHLIRWAKTKQLESVPETQIINAILHWQNADDPDGGDDVGLSNTGKTMIQ